MGHWEPTVLLGQQQSLATSTTNLQNILVSTNNTNPQLASLVVLLNQYSTLIPQAIQTMLVVNRYLDTLTQDAAGILLWAAQDATVTDSVRSKRLYMFSRIPHIDFLELAFHLQRHQVHRHQLVCHECCCDGYGKT